MKQLNWYQIFGNVHKIPDGRTVLPTDDIQIWLNCANVWDKAYTTLAEVLADTDTLLALITSNNAVNYMVRSTTWASGVSVDSSAMTYIGQNNYCANTLLADATWLNAIANSEYIDSVLNVKVPAMTSNTTPSGECFGRTYQSGHEYYRAFDGSLSTEYWSTDANNEYLGYKYPSNRTIYVFKGEVANNVGSANPITLYLQGSEDNVSYTNLADAVSYTLSASEYKMFTILATNIVANQYFRILRTVGANRFRLRDVQFYGREDV